MQADLEFEYPHKLEKLLVRSEILSWLDEEEKKLYDASLSKSTLTFGMRPLWTIPV